MSNKNEPKKENCLNPELVFNAIADIVSRANNVNVKVVKIHKNDKEREAG